MRMCLRPRLRCDAERGRGWKLGPARATVSLVVVAMVVPLRRVLRLLHVSLGLLCGGLQTALQIGAFALLPLVPEVVQVGAEPVADRRGRPVLGVLVLER